MSSGCSAARYCARRSSTLPLTGPSTRAFGGDVERVEELLHPPASSAVSLKAACKDLLRKPSADLAMALGRQISSSEQARQRSARQTGGGVRAAATKAP